MPVSSRVLIGLVSLAIGLGSCASVPVEESYYDLPYRFVPGAVAYVPVHCPCPSDCSHFHEYGNVYPDHFDSEGRHVSSRGIPGEGPRRKSLDRPEAVISTTDVPRVPDVPVVEMEVIPTPSPPLKKRVPKVHPESNSKRTKTSKNSENPEASEKPATPPKPSEEKPDPQ